MRLLPLIAGALVAATLGASESAAPPAGSPGASDAPLPSETPERFEPTNEGFDHVRREVMIPMRDGAKLKTVLIVPRGAKGAPIVLTRTPYDAGKKASRNASHRVEPLMASHDSLSELLADGGYIRAVQDIRGKHGSEGDYVMNRPLRGSRNPTRVDHSTDTWDTIDWLVKNTPETNGAVGVVGVSYDGFLALMALVDPHPALKASVPINPMVDGWIGDDWFHYGAFRQMMMPYIYDQQATRKSEKKWWADRVDAYETYLDAGSAFELGRRRGLHQVGFWRKILEHPAYDSFWREQAVDKILADRPLGPPTLIVHSLWDQEDIYGAPAVYEAVERKDKDNDKVFLVVGPWSHGQQFGDGASLGAVKFHSDTSRYFRHEVLRPFLDQHLRTNAPKADLPPVLAFETGTNVWRRSSAWPAALEKVSSKPLYLQPSLKLDFAPPKEGKEAFAEYVSDPAKPIPFCRRPIQSTGYEGPDRTWPRWLVDDQRDAASRPDVVVFISEVLDKPLKIAGRPTVNLFASTSGTDADWVVKLIDVYPEASVGEPAMGGYQLMVAADIFRGRYREGFEHPKPLEPNKPLEYRFSLPTTHHVFRKGHRIMVQVQSSWFPLYDRNPQTFVASIFQARPEDYRKAVHRVFHTPTRASRIDLPVAGGP